MPEIREKSVDLPTFGRPTKATTGVARLVAELFCWLQDEHIFYLRFSVFIYKCSQFFVPTRDSELGECRRL